MIRPLAFSLGLLCAGPVWAFELTLPAGSRLVSDRGSAFDSYALPVGPWQGGAVAMEQVEGQIARQSWRVDSASITTLQLLDVLREQLGQAGYETVFECDDPVCGGFDFRFAIEVIPSPDMYVDVRDYRFLSARNGDRVISLLVSRSRTSGFVQVVEVSPTEQATLDVVAPNTPPPASELVLEPEDPVEDFVSILIGQGHITLEDLEFETGSANLSSADYISLQDLAAFLVANPSAVLALVGHTDATGDLDVNIRVSRQRAEAVRSRLVETYDIPAAQVQAEGMGYLAPRASNLTAEGREQNRRVEAILLSLD